MFCCYTVQEDPLERDEMWRWKIIQGKEKQQKRGKKCFSFSICSVFLSNLSSSLHIYIAIVKSIHYRWSFQCGPMETLWPVFSVDVSFLNLIGQDRSGAVTVHHSPIAVCFTRLCKPCCVQGVWDTIKCLRLCLQFFLQSVAFWGRTRQTTNITKHHFFW